MKPIIRDDKSYPKALSVVGEAITVLASGDETGSYETFLQVVNDGAGPPPHQHPWDEAFFIISGEFDFMVDGKDMVLGPGAFAHVPGETVHSFRSRKDGSTMFSVTSRKGASALFADLDRDASGPNLTMEKVVEVARRHETSLG